VGSYVEFTGLQVEKGSIATPFEFRPYATELALCQRYFYVIKPRGVSSAIPNPNQMLGVGLAVPSGTGYIDMWLLISTPVAMRSINKVYVAPSSQTFSNCTPCLICANSTNEIIISNGSQNNPVVYSSTSTIYNVSLTSDCKTLNIGFTQTGLTPGSSYFVQAGGSNTYLGISNELDFLLI
jgi:hypothetical protein